MEIQRYAGAVWMFVTVGRKKFWGMAAALVLAAVLCAVWIPTHPADAEETAITNWGLSFQEEGKTPVGNAAPDYLLQYDAYYAGAADQKVIYLTFDAGYENGYTPAILDALK